MEHYTLWLERRPKTKWNTQTHTIIASLNHL